MSAGRGEAEKVSSVIKGTGGTAGGSSTRREIFPRIFNVEKAIEGNKMIPPPRARQQQHMKSGSLVSVKANTTL